MTTPSVPGFGATSNFANPTTQSVPGAAINITVLLGQNGGFSAFLGNSKRPYIFADATDLNTWIATQQTAFAAAITSLTPPATPAS